MKKVLVTCINIVFIPVILFWQVVGMIAGRIWGLMIGLLTSIRGFKQMQVYKVVEQELKSRLNKVSGR